MVGGSWPSVVTFLRVFHGALTDLDEVFLPSYYHFWPLQDFWPNTALVLVWDEESEEDRRVAGRLHAKWDALFAAKEGAAGNLEQRKRSSSWIDLFEGKPPPNMVCDVKKQGGTDRVSNYGYIRQANSFYEADQTLLRNSAFVLSQTKIDLDNDDVFILLCDSDMAFVAPAHPRSLFDHRNATGQAVFQPRLLGVWGRSAEGGISQETNFQSTPSVATFMDQQPWLVRLRDFAQIRERIRQAVFSNVHRFFIADARKFWPQDWPGLEDVPVALVRWTGISGAEMTELIRFHTHRPARPLRSFYKQPDMRTGELPFKDMQIAWLESVNMSQAPERREPTFESFSFSTAMGLVWRCAHITQVLSLHDRSASNANVLLNNLFWMPQKRNYSWYFRRLTSLPDPVLQSTMNKARSGGFPVDSRLEKWYQEYVASKFKEPALVQSFPLSRFHLSVLRQHDLSTPKGARRAAWALSRSAGSAGSAGVACKDHPHGHKILVHWNAVKTARQEAREKFGGEVIEVNEVNATETFMPQSRYALLQICLYDALWSGIWGAESPELGNPSGADSLGLGFGRRLAEQCCAHFPSRWCKNRTGDRSPRARWIHVFPQIWGERCPASRRDQAVWECPTAKIFEEEAFWRVAMILNQHLLRNPFFGQPCELQVWESPELLLDRLYLSSLDETLLDSSVSPDRSAQFSLGARSLKVERAHHFGTEGDCDTFDLPHALQCHYENLRALVRDRNGWMHWLL
ncbi:MPPED1 [Symbiodinium natans]|uniref:MPPED1 protein n=1 Tax=Symbiodinium natans TaxID=878477 RepID=A0A812UGK7_9DINO|nr:MPPED1 [Symbiodinium natans]